VIDRGPLRPLVAVASVACLPVLALATVLPRPIALSAWLGTTAIAIHWPQRYRMDRRRITEAYAQGFAVMALVALLGSLLGAPGWSTSAVGLLVLITSPAASWHPPIACLPLSVTMTTPLATLVDWGLLAVLTWAHLWCLGHVAGVLSRERPDRPDGRD
jgi:hypothetical protein